MTSASERRQHFSAATKQSLVDVAQGLFALHGYAGTSLEAIVAGAEVTKGALYHHFTGKQALFEAVFARVEERAAQRIQGVIDAERDPWLRAEAGLRTFLDIVRTPDYLRIVVQDGPAVLGYERYREREERTAYAVVSDIVGEVFAHDGRGLDPGLADTFARLFVGALSSVGSAVGDAADPDAEAARVEAAVGLVLAGLRTVAAAH
ncbi:TetR/AcrR family transcriptional regulator [Nocardioides insulae]|uniref:TetR/AcrR family transcriptional regulator n=1 Tax=Nocardioides insulae TaxID=394734 RepID=UPI000418E9C0|nr:TetR family transcriptional regulator [Nocardioides insulae]